jgi:PIN domain nuclease of toxin-antitoxin system
MSGVLLDTNALLWFGLDESFQTPALKAALSVEERFVSQVSALEMAVKQSIGKLSLPPPFQTDFAVAFRQMADRLGADILPIDLSHADRLSRLPMHHRDPFDRILIVQALQENLTVVTSDRKFRLYDGLSILEIRPQ